MFKESKRATLSGIAAVLASGCTTLRGGQIPETDTEPTERPTRPANCALHHELTSGTSTSYESEDLAYEKLSPSAKYLFEKAVENDGYVTKNESRDPPEFDYDDTPARYSIHRNDTTYTLITYSGTGC